MCLCACAYIQTFRSYPYPEIHRSLGFKGLKVSPMFKELTLFRKIMVLCTDEKERSKCGFPCKPIWTHCGRTEERGLFIFFPCLHNLLSISPSPTLYGEEPAGHRF